MGTKIPRMFTVGTDPQNDFTPETIELLILKVRDWFASDGCDRAYEDPLKEARKQVQQCLEAKTNAGKVWYGAPSTLAGRIKVKTLFDMESGNHISQQREKTPLAKANKKYQTAQAAGAPDPTALTPDKLVEYQRKVETDILEAYPELTGPVHRPNVSRLALLYAEQENIRMELLGSRGAARGQKIELLSTLQKAISDTMKSLDIYPDQVRKRMDLQRDGSVGELVALLDEDQDFKDREKLWSLTLALQLWWMTQHPNGRHTGPQLHEFEMWHLTRTRPIHYKCRCGAEAVLVEGFTPNELRDYLVENKVLVGKPTISGLMTEEDLDGLEDYGRAVTTDDADTGVEIINENGEQNTERVSTGSGDGGTN